MRYRTTGLFAFLTLAMIAGAALDGHCADSTIAVADFAMVLKEFHKTKGAEEQIEKLQNGFRADLQRMKQKLGDLEKEFEAAREKTRNPMLNEEAIRKQREEAEARLIELKEYEQKILKFNETERKNLREKSVEITRQLTDEINEIVSEYAVEKKLALVLDAGQLGLSGRGVVLYSSKTMDITDEIIAAVNKGQ